MKQVGEIDPLRRWIAAAVAVVALTFGGITVGSPASALPGPAETLGAANFGGAAWLNNTDAPANIVKVGGTLYALTSEGASQQWTRYQGTNVDNMGTPTSATTRT